MNTAEHLPYAKPRPADRSRARLLKFNCDRTIQRNTFVETLEKALVTRLSWPQVIVPMGRDCDCVETLVERLHTHELPAVLTRARLGNEADAKLLAWPRGELDGASDNNVANEIGELQKAVAESLGLNRSSPLEQIVRTLNAQQRAVVFMFDIDGEKFDARRRTEFIEALHWWTALAPSIGTPHPIIVMPWITFSPRCLLTLFRRDAVGALFSHINDLTRFGDFRDRLTVLPPLGMITRGDANDWLNANLHYASEQPADYAVKLKTFFSGRLGSEKSVTMKEASEFFGNLINDMRMEIVSSSHREAGDRSP